MSPTPRRPSRNRLRWIAWILGLYALWFYFNFDFEVYTRRRFSIRTEGQVASIADRRARLKAERDRFAALEAREDYAPFVIFMGGSTLLALAAFVAALVVSIRTVRPLKRGSHIPVHLLAVSIALPSFLAAFLVILPGMLARDHYDRHPVVTTAGSTAGGASP